MTSPTKDDLIKENHELGSASVQTREAERHKAYWHANLRLLFKLLLVWFLVSFGCGILFAPTLNQVKLIGTDFPLGFWFAQQGAIYVFVVLIFIYIKAMDRLDRKYQVNEDRSEDRDEEIQS